MMRPWKDQRWPGFTILAALTVLVGTGGCGSGRASVTGQVTYEDGSPLTEGNVIGQMGEGIASTTVQGNVKPDGTFTWGTERPGDGAKPGTYRVVVQPRALGDGELAQGMLPAVDAKFTRYETSGITFEVKEGKNELPIKVARPKAKAR